MGRRNQQHMGRSDDDRQDLVGRDVRDGDELAERANVHAVPMPNEEGTGRRVESARDEARDEGREEARDEGRDEGRDEAREEARDGGSGSRERSG